MSTPRAAAAGIVLGGRLVVAGGYTKVDDVCRPVSSVECYDPDTNVWTTLQDMPMARKYCAAATLPAGNFGDIS